jgi:hypothetical protein
MMSQKLQLENKRLRAKVDELQNSSENFQTRNNLLSLTVDHIQGQF